MTVNLYEDANQDGIPDGAPIATDVTDVNSEYGFPVDPGMTSRGMGEVEVAQIADLIDTAMINRDDSNALGKVSREVADFYR